MLLGCFFVDSVGNQVAALGSTIGLWFVIDGEDPRFSRQVVLGDSSSRTRVSRCHIESVTMYTRIASVLLYSGLPWSGQKWDTGAVPADVTGYYVRRRDS